MPHVLSRGPGVRKQDRRGPCPPGTQRLEDTATEGGNDKVWAGLAQSKSEAGGAQQRGPEPRLAWEPQKVLPQRGVTR